jgi:hypothetical protein
MLNSLVLSAALLASVQGVVHAKPVTLEDQPSARAAPPPTFFRGQHLRISFFAPEDKMPTSVWWRDATWDAITDPSDRIAKDDLYTNTVIAPGSDYLGQMKFDYTPTLGRVYTYQLKSDDKEVHVRVSTWLSI